MSEPASFNLWIWSGSLASTVAIFRRIWATRPWRPLRIEYYVPDPCGRSLREPLWCLETPTGQRFLSRRRGDLLWYIIHHGVSGTLCQVTWDGRVRLREETPDRERGGVRCSC